MVPDRKDKALAQAISAIHLLLRREEGPVEKAVFSLHPQPRIIQADITQDHTILRLAGLACEEASKAMGLGECPKIPSYTFFSSP